MLQATPAPSTDRVPANWSAERNIKSQLWQDRIANYERSALSIDRILPIDRVLGRLLLPVARKLRQSTPQVCDSCPSRPQPMRVGNIEVRLPNGISIVISLQAIDSLPMILSEWPKPCWLLNPSDSESIYMPNPSTRKSFDGLFRLVKNELGLDLRNGGLVHVPQQATQSREAHVLG